MVWHLGDVLGCVFLLVLIKFIVVATVMKSFGFSWEASTLAGACMAQVKEWEARVVNTITRRVQYSFHILSSFLWKGLVVWARTNDLGVMSRYTTGNAYDRVL